MNRLSNRLLRIRAVVLMVVLLTSVRMFGVGWTPTDAGLILNFEPGDQFLLSVWVDLDGDGVEDTGEEFFVCDYPGYSGKVAGRFTYTAENYMKLLPQPESGTWTIGDKVKHNSITVTGEEKGFTLDGICYTIWGNANNSLRSASGSNFKIFGDLTPSGSTDICDVAFVVPTDNTRSTCMDPENTLNRVAEKGDKFNGQMGYNASLGMYYREVYMFAIPPKNDNVTYQNAALITFNTTNSNKKWHCGTISPGKAGYAYADATNAKPHHKTTRTIFRIYPLNKPFSSCGSYFFAWDLQDYVRYRKSDNNAPSADYLTYRKIYTLDHFHCMEHYDAPGVPSGIFQTEGINIPENDSTYFYIGKNNAFFPVPVVNGDSLGTRHAVSKFKPIDSLRIRALRDQATVFIPAKGAYGFVAIDTAQTAANLGASFEPAGYMLRTNTDVNVKMVPNADRTVWTTEQMWTIDEKWTDLKIKATLYTGAEFDDADEGADISGWSEMVFGKNIKTTTGGDVEGQSGWARIHADSPDKNGHIEFVLADKDTCIRYHNNGHFGEDIPDQHPMSVGSKTLTIQDARLIQGYEFAGWATSPNGAVVIYPKDSTGKTLKVGDEIDLKALPDGLTLTDKVLHLYAKATYTGSINVAISFIHPTDHKRYFLTHPGVAPRFARARHFDDWTNVWQGMEDINNANPDYLSTYKIIGKEGDCEECEPGEYVLDPRRDVMHGAEDSLVFYEFFAPSKEEYIGLYYTDPNLVIANNTWAGLFQSSKGWPTPAKPCIDSTRLFSTHYLRGIESTITREVRSNSSQPNIKYNTETDQFEGVVAGDSTVFMISGVGVVDAHYVILPDTTDDSTPWRNEVVFDYHTEAQHEYVWSKLIGKQLLAQMKVGKDTIYFHPNTDKTISDANQLRISSDYRLTHDFEYVRDTRPDVAIPVANRATMEETSDAFCCSLTSGANSPMNVMDGENYIDIVDTLRVWLHPSRTSKIKEYYGRWSNNAVDSILPNGDRYRDILVKTKTYHYSANQIRWELTPENSRYSFNPVAGNGQDLKFTLTKVTYRQLLDVDGTSIREDVISRETKTTNLTMLSSYCTLAKAGSSPFAIEAVADSTVRISAINKNEGEGNLEDVLVVSRFQVGAETIILDTPVRVTLIQTTFALDELFWSAVSPVNGKRYFIIAKGDGTFDFREFTQRDVKPRGVILYQLNTWTHLIKGAENSANTNTRYITPWRFTYSSENADQLFLRTECAVNQHLKYVDGTPGSVALRGDDSTAITYKYVTVNTNDNGNTEEVVKLKFSTDKWLRFTGSAFEFTDEEHATAFSWGYMRPEYQLLNNGTYPSIDEVVFGYNNGGGKTVQTRYKAYRERSMLLNNSLVYLCREEMQNLTTLKNEEWQTNWTITKKDDQRFAANASGFGISTNSGDLVTTVTPASATSPTEIRYPAEKGPFVDIVDTLLVTLSTTREDYRFDYWTGVSSIRDASLKIPLVRKTYHSVPYDSVVCYVDREQYDYAFPSTLRAGHREDSLHTFSLQTIRRLGSNILNVDNEVTAYVPSTPESLTSQMDLNNPALSEIRLVDNYGQTPDWCEIQSKGTNTVTVRCKSSGIRSPRSARLYFAYVVTVAGQPRYVNFRLTVGQASKFNYANNQHLVHSPGASGDPLEEDGRQRAHENKRILYYYNPRPYGESDQNVELPVRERGFYGWWRWYQENPGVEDTDIPDSVWLTPPRNTGEKDIPYRIIGDSVMLKKANGTDSIKVLATMGRYTVFHYPSNVYKNKWNPPANSPEVMAPWNKDTVTYVVDISNYYDNLPLSMKDVNQVDRDMMDTLISIVEPTLSLREVFELHPWTEMAEKMEAYKDTIARPTRNLKYLEDHVVLAPVGNRLLLPTEQRYIREHLAPQYDNNGKLKKPGHSESLLGYYMRDDNWSTWTGDKDTMIWCGGYDVDCKWYIYNPSTKTYSDCNYSTSVDDDFLIVPARGSLASERGDTVILCLRARSKSTTISGSPAKETTVDGLYWFNICRYTIIYHYKEKFGPQLESTKNGIAKAIITNDEIEQNYEVLERLNFDYAKPGDKDYHIYPHPLPWTDGSYGYMYPERPDLPHNRYHAESDFPGPGEYSLINKIPSYPSDYWRPIEQHGGAENGYMIYCDGMSSAGQVAALTLSTQLCEGQKMYFSGFVGNVATEKQKDKSRPNFTFSVQGSKDGENWTDITSYMTGDIERSDNWYQIFFPITQEGSYDHFRIRIFNMASTFDGNDFVIDDMCVFATKPPLIAYQADTKCVTEGTNDSLTNMVLRIDYQGFVDTLSYNLRNVYYTVERTKGTDTSFVKMEDNYINQIERAGVRPKPDTILGYIPMPAHIYEPDNADSIFANLQQLVDTFDVTYKAWEKWNKTLPHDGEAPPLFRKGYLYEILDGITRPVMYVVHKAKMTPDNTYTIRLSTGAEGLMNGKCAMTSNLRVTNRMILELNGEEVKDNDVSDMCANATYELSMRVKGSILNLDSLAPMDVNGSCVNDWLLYGDTSDVTSVRRYGYKYSDIKKVIKDVLRKNDDFNVNRFVTSLASVNKNDIIKYAQYVTLSDGVVAYDLLDSLVSKGFLTMYQSKLTTTVARGDSIQYVIFPIEGTGSRMANGQNMGVCPSPIFVKLKPNKGGHVPMMIGGIHRDSTQAQLPVVVLVDEQTANNEFKLHVDSLMPNVAIQSISLLTTDDPDFYNGTYILNLTPDKIYTYGESMSGYYTKGSDIVLRPAMANTYLMRQGYNYTFSMAMQTLTGSLNWPESEGGCPVGEVLFTVSVVPKYLRWAPQSANNNKWNDPNNWLGVDDSNNPLPNNPRFAPIGSTDVIIPNLMSYGLPYPVLPSSIGVKDSVKEVNFTYNTCDDIRFLPGAAISQQQLLDCDVTVVDMTIPNQHWALRSTPLTGMLSGDLFMANADLRGESRPWYVGTFDANGRNYNTGNATFWLSLYNSTTVTINAKTDNDTTVSESAQWSRAANSMTLSLPPAQGWAVYTHTKSETAADIRLPKQDDIFYYYGTYGERLDSRYEDNLLALRASYAGASGSGEFAFKPGAEADHQNYTLSNAVASTSFVFGNPTMGYIDIWGFIADNSLAAEIAYLDASGNYVPVTSETTGVDTITNQARYLPPMHAMMINTTSSVSSKVITLNTNRIVTHPSQKVRPLPAPASPAPQRATGNLQSAVSKGIMTVTAVNPVSNRCVSRLLLGQGYHDEIRSGEDAVLTTLNIDKFSMTNTPTTPFNIYAMEGAYGMSIDLLSEVVNVPISFYMSALPYAPTTQLWFTGVGNIDGQLVLYDALTDTERPIQDGIYLTIETPEASHEKRYYIRRRGFTPGGGTDDPLATGVSTNVEQEPVVKILRNGQVLIIRNGHVYTMFGQKIR